MFATDRDLLALEPGVFGRVSWVGQRLVNGMGSVAGGVLTLSSPAGAFATAGVSAGHVVTVGEAALEVVSVVSGSSAEVSRPRASSADPAATPIDISDAAVRVSTFAPQLADVHRRVLAMLGLEPAGSPVRPTSADVVNGWELSRLEALGALHLIFAAAAATMRGQSPEWEKAEWYRARFDEERRRVRALIDLDGDGVADAVRRPTAARFVRV